MLSSNDEESDVGQFGSCLCVHPLITAMECKVIIKNPYKGNKYITFMFRSSLWLHHFEITLKARLSDSLEKQSK